MVTKITMRWKIITKKNYEQRMDYICKEKDDLTKPSFNDDLDSLFEEIRLGKEQNDWVETNILAKVTEKELKSLQRKNINVISLDDNRLFGARNDCKLFTNPFQFPVNKDMTRAETKVSESDSKYVERFGYRRTFTIKNPLKRKISSSSVDNLL